MAAPCLLILAGCQTHSTPSTPPKPALTSVAPNAWIAYCNDPSASEPALLWNGLVGLRFGRDGSGLDPASRPLPRFDITGYETSGEEKIKREDNPVVTIAQADQVILNPEAGSRYLQSLDMRTGLLSTTWEQRVGEATVTVEHDVVLHPTDRWVGERWLLSSVNPSQKPPTFRVSPAISASTPNGAAPGTAVFDKVYWLPDPARPNYVSDVSYTFDQLLQVSKATWAKRWQTDIEIDGPVEDQQAVHSFLFYLRSAISPDGKMAISPFGLSDSTYNGHIFWDADIWVFPALALIDPANAARIPKYRLDKLSAAQTNFRHWESEGRPIAKGKLGPTMSDMAILDAKYPWESSVSGGETAPGPSRFESHITGSVAFGINQAAALGLVPEADAHRVITFAKGFYLERSEDGPTGRVIRQTMSPDENFVGDNDLYTNLLADWLAHDGTWAPKPIFKLPKDSTSFLTYDGDPVRSYKQAAAVLSIYPLQYPEAEAEAKTMMDRFSGKAIKNGPAMTDSVHALIWARLGDSDKAYQTWQDSWQPFMRGPLCLFAEKRSKPTAYFTTGAAGSLQTLIYGFLGFRLDSEQRRGPAWSTPLIGNRYLSVRPQLPKEWKSVKFKNFTILGRRYTLTATQDSKGGSCRVTQGD
jgi:trehalose/maltose hydrolase-like predicted phosphorylase